MRCSTSSSTVTLVGSFLPANGCAHQTPPRQYASLAARCVPIACCRLFKLISQSSNNSLTDNVQHYLMLQHADALIWSTSSALTAHPYATLPFHNNSNTVPHAGSSVAALERSEPVVNQRRHSSPSPNLPRKLAPGNMQQACANSLNPSSAERNSRPRFLPFHSGYLARMQPYPPGVDGPPRTSKPRPLPTVASSVVLPECGDDQHDKPRRNSIAFLLSDNNE